MKLVQPKTMKPSYTLTLAVGAFLLIATAVIAQGPPKNSQLSPTAQKDLREIATFRLTMDNLKKYSAATETLAEAAKNDPSLRQEPEDEQEPESIDELAQQLGKHPQALNAFRRAGLSPREYAVITETVLVNGVALMGKQMGTKQLPPGATEQNMSFLQTHQKEWEQLKHAESQGKEE